VQSYDDSRPPEGTTIGARVGEERGEDAERTNGLFDDYVRSYVEWL
jgi:hypothetical protein